MIENYNMSRGEELSFPEGSSLPLLTEGFLYLPVNKSFYPEGAVNMLLAKRLNELVEATPQSVAECPHCHEDVVSKCGDIMAWHWAHKVKCIYDTEPETEWHLAWKRQALEAGLAIEHVFDRHITDAVNLKTKSCYEFQHSPISHEGIVGRSIHYRSHGFSTSWVFDYSKKFEDEQITLKELDDNVYSFHQKWQKKTISSCFEGHRSIYGTVYLDFGDLNKDTVFLVKKLYDNGNGWGKFLPTDTLLYTGRRDFLAR